MNVKDKISLFVDRLEEIKEERRVLRKLIIEYIRNNIDYFPEDVSTGKLFHQINRKSKIRLQKMGDTCDKELIKDARIIISNKNH